MSKISGQDKKLIVDGINQIKTCIKEKKFKEAHDAIRRIKPVVTRTGFANYEFVVYQSFLAKDEGDPKSCIEFATQALRLKPNDQNSQKLLIMNYGKLNDKENLQKQIISYLSNHQNDEKQDGKFLAENISIYIKEFDEDHHEDITLPFVNCFKKVPDYQTYKIVDNLPDTSDIVDFRISLLLPFAESDQTFCEMLVETLLYDADKSQYPPTEILKYAQMLPKNNRTRLRVEAFYSPNPLQTARKFDEVTNSHDFQKFIEAAESTDLKNMYSQLMYINHFYSGWLYYAGLTNNPKEQLYAYQRALEDDPASVDILTKILSIHSEQGDINQGIETINKISKVDKNAASKVITKFIVDNNLFNKLDLIESMGLQLSSTDASYLALYQYKEGKDKAPIRNILNLQCTEETAEIRARAIYILRNELGDKVQPLFAECLKNAKTNATIYCYFGKYLKEIGLIDKSTLLYEKAVEYGLVDDEVFEVVSRKFIKEDKIDEALQLCLKVNNDWSHFRAGLILQRQNKHEMASKQFQKEITDHPNNFNAWRALGQSYLVLGRIMDCHSVLKFLKEKGEQDHDLENQLSLIYEKPIIPSSPDLKQSMYFDHSPAPFYSYLAQEIITIQRLMLYGRVESAKIIIERVEPFINDYINQWNSLASVHKICGEFYVNAFKVLKDPNFLKKAFMNMKKRAEIDIRPESFVDLASILIEMGQIEQSIAVLKKVLHKFPDSALLWTNLGVAYALSNDRMAFARHCLCVAAKIASDSEKGKVYVYYSTISNLLNNKGLANRAGEEAERANPYDPDVQLLKMILTQQEESEQWKNDPISHKRYLQKELDIALVSFEDGATTKLIPNIPRLMLKLNRPLEALGFSLLSQDQELISKSYEAIGQYEAALTFAQNEETKNRLLALLGQKQQAYEIANLCNEKRYQEALSYLMSQECKSPREKLIKDIAIPICYGLLNENHKAVELLTQVRKNLTNEGATLELIEKIQKLTLIYSSSSNQSNLKSKSAELMFLNFLRCNDNNKKLAAEKTLEQCKGDPKALSIYLIVAFQNMDDLYLYDQKVLLKNANELMKRNPSRLATKLLLLAQYNAQMYKKAYTTINSLYMIAPKEIQKTVNLFANICKNRDIPEPYADDYEEEEEEDY